MSKFKKGDLVMPSKETLSSTWWYYYEVEKWPQLIKSSEDGYSTLDTCRGNWHDIYLDLVDEENE